MTIAKPVAVSLVTTVLNDRAGCVAFFEQMARQTRPPDEIVVVDGGSRDGTWEWLQEASAQSQPWRLQARQERGCNVARGRDLAIEAAAHELIASTDVGCEWEPEWLAELVAPFDSHPECQAVMGSWSVRKEDLPGVWAQVEYALLLEPKMLATKRSDASSRSIAYKRELWRRLGGYPEDLTLAADDLTFAILLHLRTPEELLAAAPVPRCHWSRLSTFHAFRKEARRNFRGNGEAGIMLDYGLKVGGRMLVEICLFAFGLAALSRRGSEWLAISSLLLVLASLALRIRRLRAPLEIARRLGIPQPLGRLLIFDYATKFWGVVGFWEGWLRGRRQCLDCRRRLREAYASARVQRTSLGS